MWSDLLHRLRALFRRKQVEAELDDELRFHFERAVDKHLAAGLTREQAVRRARLAFGGIEQVKEECRDARGISFLETTLQDVRYALRVLRKSPGFTVAVVLSLGLGIGANTAIFSLIDAVMLRMLPVRQPEELVSLARRQGDGTGYGFTYKLYRQLAEAEGRSFNGLAAYSPVRLNVSVDGGIEPTAEGLMVSGDYFSVLG